MAHNQNMKLFVNMSMNSIYILCRKEGIYFVYRLLSLSIIFLVYIYKYIYLLLLRRPYYVYR